jgi:hypothetical protein
MKSTKQQEPIEAIQIGAAAKLLDTTPTAIRKRIGRNAIPFIRTKDGHTFFNPEKLLEWKRNLKKKGRGPTR